MFKVISKRKGAQKLPLEIVLFRIIYYYLGFHVEDLNTGVDKLKAEVKGSPLASRATSL